MTPKKKALFSILIGFFALILVFFLWQALKPVPTEGDWQTPLAVLSTAEFEGDSVTVKNVRNFRYRGSEQEKDLEPAYYDKTYDLNQVVRVWYVTEPFKNLSIAAHTFLSFEFSNGDFLSISIEARKRKGQDYNLFLGMLRTYPLMYIAADERDSVFVRANIRKSDVYVYPVKIGSTENAKMLLTDMLNKMNDLVVHPAWYNTLWANCTSSIARHVNQLWPHRLKGLQWQLWLTGYADELVFKSGLIDADLSLEGARKAFGVTEKSQRIGNVENYSRLIRE
ncbi:MAG: DUF4105 domain-containing protein [Candidatus Uhrbacteria bacterium]|nr:DUF4105 domain-containing protein [Candidatus Uhrbacteria bacterium]